jgi:hypothetical protein
MHGASRPMDLHRTLDISCCIVSGLVRARLNGPHSCVRRKMVKIIRRCRHSRFRKRINSCLVVSLNASIEPISAGISLAMCLFSTKRYAICVQGSSSLCLCPEGIRR